MPVIDALAGLNPANRSGEDGPALAANPWLRAVTWSWVPIQLTLCRLA